MTVSVEARRTADGGVSLPDALADASIAGTHVNDCACAVIAAASISAIAST